MDGQDVIRAIAEAFEQVDFPAAAELVNDHCDECIETYRVFWSRPLTFMTWQEAASRPGSHTAAALLSVAAWRYYLPAMIVWCLRDTEDLYDFDSILVYQLTPRGPSKKWFEPRSVGFSVEQRRAITGFLEWYWAKEAEQAPSSGADEVAEAIRYWSGG
jgi:hypothetical protein